MDQHGLVEKAKLHILPLTPLFLLLLPQVVLVIDTSSSMGQRLDLVKHKLLQLMQAS